jgi:2-polyprenyl-3-methyl-5-hydroxy-6-metoxy-1,4-benzoquinol methylase
MPTDYNAIADQYKRSKLTPWRRYIEQYSYFEILGDVSGLSVLDLACGEGFYSRLLRLHGAARVVGMDMSERMILLARATEAEQPLDVEYVVGDALTFRTDERFDVVTACYLLNYAQTDEQLAKMCATIAAALKPGGRLVAVNNNPRQSPSRFEATRPYGFVKSVAGELRAGTPITYTLFLENESFSFDNYYLSPEAHERALERAGLRDVEWLQPRLSPAWQGDPGYWDDFFTDPSVIFLQARFTPGRAVR